MLWVAGGHGCDGLFTRRAGAGKGNREQPVLQQRGVYGCHDGKMADAFYAECVGYLFIDENVGKASFDQTSSQNNVAALPRMASVSAKRKKSKALDRQQIGAFLYCPSRRR